MPSVDDWISLARSTWQAVGRRDLSGIYSSQWPVARAELTAGFADELARPGGRVKRFLRTSNAVLYGLARRLAPARRVLFGAVLVCLLLSFSSHYNVTLHHGTKTTSYGLYFDNFFLWLSILLLGLLLAMELVDKIAYRDELELARELQASLIPTELPQPPGFEIAAHNEIANMVGGDIYDFAELPDGRLAILFGDASGHGMTAGLVMAVAHAAFRTQLDVDPEPAAMFGALNRILCRTGTSRAFFGAVYLLFAPDGSFSGSIAGHPPILRVDASGRVLERIGRGAYPLGIKPDLSWEIERGRLARGQSFVLCSDGVTEAHDVSGNEFDEGRVEAALSRVATLPPSGIVEAIARGASDFRGGGTPEDDLSIAVVRYRG